MQRAKVCVRSITVSGESHLRLVKAKDLLPEIADQEAAYLDNTGMVCVCVFIPSNLAIIQRLQLAGAATSRAVGHILFTVSIY